jgi:hypothetical protein
VLDVEYTGNLVRFGALRYNEISAAKAEEQRYPIGKEVEVFYDPKHPSTAVLVKGAAEGVWVFIGLGSVFVVIGTFLFFLLPKVITKTN